MATECWMFEVYYTKPRDHEREDRLTEQVIALGGRLDFWEQGEIPVATYICLTYEFDGLKPAQHAAEILQQQGEHVEGPVPYGPDGPA